MDGRKIIFQPGKPQDHLGLRCHGNRIVGIVAGSQAAHVGIRTGWIIYEVNGQQQADNSIAIYKNIEKTSCVGKPTKIHFIPSTRHNKKKTPMEELKNQSFFFLAPYASAQDDYAACSLILSYVCGLITDDLVYIIVKYCQSFGSISSFLKEYNLKLNDTVWKLGNKRINDNHCLTIADVLGKSETLKRLALGTNQIGDMGVQHLANVLNGKGYAQEISFKAGRIGIKYVANKIALVVENSQASLGGVQPNWIIHKVNGVVQGNKQEDINLAIKKTQTLGKNTVIEFLRYNIRTSLTTLSLRRNRIGNHGAATLAEAVKVNYTLEELWLNSNHISDDGANALARALYENTILHCLALYDNKMNDTGICFLNKAKSSRDAPMTYGMFWPRQL